jgi:hypothetical protein
VCVFVSAEDKQRQGDGADAARHSVAHWACSMPSAAVQPHVSLCCWRPQPCSCTQNSGSLYALWPDGTCESLGLAGSVNTSLPDLLSAVVSASNPPATAAAINARLAQLVSSGTAGSGDGDGSSGAQSPTALVASLTFNCTDVVMSAEPNADALQRSLYCGYHQARCNGSGETNQ